MQLANYIPGETDIASTAPCAAPVVLNGFVKPLQPIDGAGPQRFEIPLTHAAEWEKIQQAAASAALPWLFLNTEELGRMPQYKDFVIELLDVEIQARIGIGRGDAGYLIYFEGRKFAVNITAL